MSKQRFNPMQTLYAALRDPAIRAAASSTAVSSLETVDGWANGLGYIEMSSLPAVLALAGLEITRTDYLDALTVLAQIGIRSGVEQ